jgi:shikimate dehydrogenase
MAMRADILNIQKFISNTLDSDAIGVNRLAGIIGDGPSHYSKSPALWNAAFGAFGMDAIYLPFDVDAARLGELTMALKASDRFLGLNVTVPHKVKIIDFLDELDPGAVRIQAVNTVVKTASGKLIGYNTDGEGFLESILQPQPGQHGSFIQSLKGMDVLLLGAGGSARAVAFHVADHLQGGQLIISNRTAEHAHSLADEIHKLGPRSVGISEENTPSWATKVGLIINSTTKGQAGLRQIAHGRVTNLEPYSSLAPAHPPLLAAADGSKADCQRDWLATAQPDIASNNQASLALAKLIPRHVNFYDLIYHPEESVFLRHGRETGHQTMNGRAMIINQAVIAFCQHICRADLQAKGMDTAATGKQILQIMSRAW